MPLIFSDDRSRYEIHLFRGAANEVGRFFDLSRKVLVVTDSGVPESYVQNVLAQCPMGFLHVLHQGDRNKDLNALSEILSALLEHGFCRRDAIIALGGGLVGDMAGLASSLYMRGIAYCNIPTTLLSQVDSSIGGKTAVNFHGVKNLVGAFYQPSAVIVDPDLLMTLPRRLFLEGMAEVIKMAAISSPSFFSKIESSCDLLKDVDLFINEALRIKLDIVMKDPLETGLRRVLNFGHTVGHALESASLGALYHGEAVALGMLYLSEGTARQRIFNLILKIGLPTRCDITLDKILPLIRSDKKSDGDHLTLVKVLQIGSYEFQPMTFECLESLISNFDLHEEQHWK